MKVVYIAGPFRAGDSWSREQNIRRAEEAALNVWRIGCACICPHTNTRFFDGAAPDSVWLEGDLEILLRCDAVLMVGNFKASKGAMEEMRVALKFGLPVFTDIVGIVEWIERESAKESLK